MNLVEMFRELGRYNALKLRAEAKDLTGTEIIDRENSVPMFNAEKDYSEWPLNAPVSDNGQVWLLLQQHNAANYPTLRPETNRACWGLAHTKNPEKAKAWVDAYGTSGMYMTGECYMDEDGVVYRALQDNLVHNAAALPSAWEVVA
jgi:hypothetical protein